MKKALLSITVLVLAFASCKKYEDGPAISLNTKKHRLVNTWVIEEAYQDGNNITASFKNTYSNYTLDVRKDDSYFESYLLYGTTSEQQQGNWKMAQSKVNVYFTPTATSTHYTWKILKLKEKSVWASTDAYGGVLEVHFKPQ